MWVGITAIVFLLPFTVYRVPCTVYRSIMAGPSQANKKAKAKAWFSFPWFWSEFELGDKWWEEKSVCDSNIIIIGSVSAFRRVRVI